MKGCCFLYEKLGKSSLKLPAIKSITVKYIIQSASSNNLEYFWQLFRHLCCSTKQTSVGFETIKTCRAAIWLLLSQFLKLFSFTWKLIFRWVLLLLETLLFSRMAFKIYLYLFAMDHRILFICLIEIETVGLLGIVACCNRWRFLA